MTVTREEALEIFRPPPRNPRLTTLTAASATKTLPQSFEFQAPVAQLRRHRAVEVPGHPGPRTARKAQADRLGMAGALDDASHLVVLLAKKGLRYDTPWMRRTPRKPQPHRGADGGRTRTLR